MVPRRTVHPLATAMESVRQRCAARSSEIYTSPQALSRRAAPPSSRREYSADECTVRTALRRSSNQVLYPRPCPEGWMPEAVSANSPPQPTAIWQPLLTGFDQLDCNDHRSALAVLKLLPGFDCTFGSSRWPSSSLAPRIVVVSVVGDLWRAEGQPERVPTGF
ncbi:hypothetical protein B0H17DRAFT_1334166 [Mycena rosella]|uniref:Uncharacterized protein n=1 Tax=Mycena rosella TaxID=1033263 RepID=A0AAD7GD72_MYCRO|nr:hypothetical protein B0H17DRAFT_1334166 [Mycena rosella]